MILATPFQIHRRSLQPNVHRLFVFRGKPQPEGVEPIQQIMALIQSRAENIAAFYQGRAVAEQSMRLKEQRSRRRRRYGLVRSPAVPSTVIAGSIVLPSTTKSSLRYRMLNSDGNGERQQMAAAGGHWMLLAKQAAGNGIQRHQRVAEAGVAAVTWTPINRRRSSSYASSG